MSRQPSESGNSESGERLPSRETAPIFLVRETHGIQRVNEPIQVGIPFPDADLRFGLGGLVDSRGARYACQWEVLSRWPSRRPRWALATALVSMGANESRTFGVDPTLACEQPEANATHRMAAKGSAKGGVLSLLSGNEPAQTEVEIELQAIRSGGERLVATISGSRVHQEGPILRNVTYEGTLGGRRPINFSLTLTQYVSVPRVRLDVTLHNPRRAEHPGGFWDLGDPQSERFESVTLRLVTSLSQAPCISWSESPGDRWYHSDGPSWSLVQLGSGGENWNSRVHVNASGAVPLHENGYRLTRDSRVSDGRRSTPSARLRSPQGTAELTMLDFWQKFPSQISVDRNVMEIGIFPGWNAGPHELQAGERTTRTVWLSLDSSDAPAGQLDWVHSPLVSTPLLEDVGNDGAPSSGRSSSDFGERRGSPIGADWLSRESSTESQREYLESLLSGPNNFFAKRERVDEYGWRHFGDVWADHEGAYSDDPKPVISHYNNQYDLLHGLCQQHLLTADERWWQLAKPLAEHVIDIDLYHTREDRAVYNGGLFWHTSHYRNASTCTHRSCSRNMVGDRHHVAGGGPGNEHNYTSGLLLYYHLTGERRARQAVLSLADWVLAMDDGERSVLAPLSGAATGKASITKDAGYHGLGRGVGNSINALIDGWQLSGERRYALKCRELIRRCTHPEDDIDRLNLLNAESRWSYPVALQALVRFDWVMGNSFPETREYVRDCLGHHGRWMWQNERYFLDNRESLEFPTETWAAQDLRKGATMMLLAQYGAADESDAVFRRGCQHFDGAWEQLMQFDSRYLTRPAAIVLQQLPIAWFAKRLWTKGTCNLIQKGSVSTSTPVGLAFCCQKRDIKRRLRSPAGTIGILARSARPSLWRMTIPETPLGRLYRRWLRG